MDGSLPHSNQEAVTVTKVITNEFFFLFSPPEQLHLDQLHSDQGKQLESQLILEIASCLALGRLAQHLILLSLMD